MMFQFIKTKDKLPKDDAQVLGFVNDNIPLEIYQYIGGEFYDNAGFMCRVSYWTEMPNSKEFLVNLTTELNLKN